MTVNSYSTIISIDIGTVYEIETYNEEDKKMVFKLSDGRDVLLCEQ